ncbi:hypothetical protein BJ508DRAFT_217886 [Ascobolus immersus RN42]|uniref:RBR-type E3 ubiquitin transferase n=1 Tax=Ascobolus immersus RN42 TaxID=1160509 RepID=A0A3N4HAN6_ASCIM|nr:hypothetical protein BJ508DRAFT_217886 [Ascobolus immersus RN42]
MVKAVECVLCFDTVKRKKTVKVYCRNKHRYCKPCLRYTFLAAINSEAVYPPRCIGCSTNGIDQEQHAGSDIISTAQVLTPSSGILKLEEIKAFRQASVEYSAPFRERIYCHHPTCRKFLPMEGRDTIAGVARCTSGCRKQTCLVCKGGITTTKKQHDVACKRSSTVSDMMFMDTAAKEGWKQCLKCTTMVELRDGSHHISCTCGWQFCYACQAQWGIRKLRMSHISFRT